MSSLLSYQRVISNKWLISAVLAAIIFVLLPKHTDPLQSTHQYNYSYGQEYIPTFRDLDHDGTDEIFLSGYYKQSNRISLIVNNYDGYTIHQLNLYDVVPIAPKPFYFFSDINGDGMSEIIVPYAEEEQISILVWNPFSKDSALVEKHYPIRTFDLKIELSNQLAVMDLKMVNFNQVDEGELLFVIYGGYEFHQHRQLALLNLKTGDCQFSEEYCNNILSILVHDLNGDGKDEIMGLMGAPDNSKPDDHCVFPDQDAYFMVYNQDLKLINSPPVIKGPTILINPFRLRVKDSTQIIAVIHKGGTLTGKDYLIALDGPEKWHFLDSLGSEKNRIGEYMTSINWQNDRFLLLHDTNHYEVRGLSGECISKGGIKGGHNQFFTIDMDQNGIDEILSYDRYSGRLCLFSFKGRLLSTAKLNYRPNDMIKSVGVAFFEDEYHPFIAFDETLELISWTTNWFHYLKWLMLIGLFLSIWSFIELILWTQRKQIEERNKLELKVKRLQVQSVKNQLDPHFTFNALNVLSYLSQEDDKEGLNSFVNHFSKLLRRQVETSDKSYTTLYDEIRFVDHYIELQKLRFDQPIQYDLDVQVNMDMNLRIPKMMIHTHVENAIKHGLIPAGGGTLWVRIIKLNSHTQIEIENDGAPRSESSGEMNGSTGKGLAILNQLYDLFYQLYKVKIKQAIIDLKDKEGNPKGTKVVIKL